MLLTQSVGRYALITSLFIFPFSANAQQSPGESVSQDVAIEGYSPVSYFEKGFAERGRPEFSVDHGDKTYYLASADQMEKFRQNPDKYKPRFGLCPYSLTLGRKVAIDPTSFKIVAGSLLLFHNSEELDALKKWNEKDDDLGQLRQAEKNYEALRKRGQLEQQGGVARGNKGNAGNVIDLNF